MDFNSAEAHAWHQIKPECAFNDVQLNEFYHIPPYMGRKGKDIKITSRTSSKIWYRELRMGNTYNFHIMDSMQEDSIEFKIMRKHKVQTVIDILKKVAEK